MLEALAAGNNLQQTRRLNPAVPQICSDACIQAATCASQAVSAISSPCLKWLQRHWRIEDQGPCLSKLEQQGLVAELIAIQRNPTARNRHILVL